MLYSTYLTLNNEHIQLDTHIEHTEALNFNPNDPEEENYYREVMYCRRLSAINTHDVHLREVKSFAVQSFIVQLWALNEKHLSQALKLFSKESKLQFAIPSKWDDTIKTLKDLEIDTEIIPATFSALDELRVLNNKIKHLGEVDSKLAEFESFKHSKGMSIDDLELDLQRYLNCSYAFFVFLSEQLSSKVLNPTLRNKLLASPRYTELCE